MESLAAAYETELDLARQDNPATHTGQPGLSSWYHATAWTLDEVRRAQAALYGARTLDIHIDTRDEIMLLIDGHPVLVTWPRPAAQRDRETALAAAFCRLHACPDDDETAAVARQAETLQGNWVFEQLRPPAWQSDTGIRCEFHGSSERAEQERICGALVVDMQALAAALTIAVRRGEHIDWTRINLRAEHNGSRHAITVNARGDYITAYIPALATQPIDWHEVQV